MGDNTVSNDWACKAEVQGYDIDLITGMVGKSIYMKEYTFSKLFHKFR